MLFFLCSTCSFTYDAELVAGKLIYMDGNKRSTLKDGNDDCYNCEIEIKEAEKQAREEIRSKKKQAVTN